ncbi:MAG: hypothetical protein JW941_00950, partial [Candidatus Coatesbacteria bacterium]|nr:hypothetical protein [Candidatus Coatesbacteria bacterium]
YSAVAGAVANIVGERKGINRPIDQLLPDITPEKKHQREQVLQLEFGFNIEEIIDMTRDAGVGLILGAPCPNYRDYIETGWRFGSNVPPEQQFGLMESFYSALDELRKGDLDACERDLRKLAAEHYFSPLHFWLGRCLEQKGEFKGASEEYSMALETSRAGGRITKGLKKAMRDAAEGNSITFVDFLPKFAAESPNGIVGRTLILDNCHPNIRGHQIMARAILAAGKAAGLIATDCSLDGFEGVMSKFTEDNLDWLPASFPKEDIANWPKPMPEITLDGYTAGMAEWLADYLEDKSPESSKEWRQKADMLKRGPAADNYGQ